MKETNIKYRIFAVLVAATLLAAYKVRSINPSCMNVAGSYFQEITWQCATCIKGEDGKYYKFWNPFQTNSCSGTVYTDTCGWDLSCGQNPTFNIYDVAENVSVRPYNGTCAGGACLGTRGSVTNIDNFNKYGGSGCY